MNLNELRDRAYQNAKNKGFHNEGRATEHWLMLIISELGEAVEAERKSARSSSIDELKKLDKEDFQNSYNLLVKGTVEEELADVVIRLLDFAGLKGYDLSNISRVDTNVLNTFTEQCYYIAELLICWNYDVIPLSHAIKDALGVTFYIADIRGIDLMGHIELKMRFNEQREYLHGKQF